MTVYIRHRTSSLYSSRTAFVTQMPMIATRRTVNSLSVTAAESFLCSLAERKPPNIPAVTMAAKDPPSKAGTVPVSRLMTRLAIWLSKMIRRELTAAVLVSMEKK